MTNIIDGATVDSHPPHPLTVREVAIADLATKEKEGLTGTVVGRATFVGLITMGLALYVGLFVFLQIAFPGTGDWLWFAYLGATGVAFVLAILISCVWLWIRTGEW